MRKTWVLLPAYNEAASLPGLLPKLASLIERRDARLGEVEIVVCNDGSSDGTAELLADFAQALPLTVLHHRINRGLGETERDLFEYAAEHCQDGDVIVRLDCDDSHEPDYIASLAAKVLDGHDVAIASRFAPGGGQIGLNGYRRFISLNANRVMRVFFPIKGIREYSCGYRAYSGRIIRLAYRQLGNDFIQLKGLGFTCTLEMLIKLRLLGASFCEAPFVLRYDQKLSASKMVSSITTLGYMVMVILCYWPWGGWRTSDKFRCRTVYTYGRRAGSEGRIGGAPEVKSTGG